MPYKLFADLTALVHLLFVIFVIIGGLFVFKWKRIAWIHLPAAVWGALIEFAGWYCPLTNLEIFFLEKAEIAGYKHGFVEHYILPVIYPAALTRELQIILGLFVVSVNIIIYMLVIYQRGRKK